MVMDNTSGLWIMDHKYLGFLAEFPGVARRFEKQK